MFRFPLSNLALSETALWIETIPDSDHPSPYEIDTYYPHRPNRYSADAGVSHFGSPDIINDHSWLKLFEFHGFLDLVDMTGELERMRKRSSSVCFLEVCLQRASNRSASSHSRNTPTYRPFSLLREWDSVFGMANK
jgi:hypothetical protein